MNPQVPDYPVGGPSPWAANSPASSTVVAQPLPTPAAPAPVPYPTTPPTPRRRPGWYAVWSMVGLALLLAITAVVLSVVTLKTHAATPTNVTAAPPAPTFSADQIAVAKKEACDASNTAAKSIAKSQANFAAAARDRLSPDYRLALGNFQLVATVETQYMERHLHAATPSNVAAATNSFIDAILGAVDAETRQVSDQQAQSRVDQVDRASNQLNEVCE